MFAERPTDSRDHTFWLWAMFDCALRVRADVVLWERDEPEAPAALKAWAAALRFPIEHRYGKVEDMWRDAEWHVLTVEMHRLRRIDIYLLAPPPNT